MWVVNKPIILSPDFNAIGKFTVNCSSTAGSTFLYAPDKASAKKMVLFDLTVIGCNQPLDNFQWVNVRFRGATVDYEGGQLNLANVIFQNCKVIGRPADQKVLDLIRAQNGKPINLLIPGVGEN